MTDPILKAAQRERRRIILSFTLVLIIALGVLGTGWWTAWTGRDAWHEQSISWQDRYLELYEEFIEKTGEEPNAPDPDVVAGESPEPVVGAPGPVGPTGPQGRGPTTQQIQDAVDVFCGPLACAGPSGKTGATGRPGAPGAPGSDGATGLNGSDSTVPGPQGPQGSPGTDGKDGAPGRDGTSGSDGRGIQTLTCDTDGVWQVTYTDGTTATAGACRTIETPEE